eukprot:TRINITY_DN12811_c0_g1_i1.p1 TRINITY_DN12811_c0_g1~~TRINITY_DN12811_c0_g1_i1.p1  ORF type:complete len:264 (+),score=64.80 TRINITY_DN12811_c0_g1_i1:170-961(+)
MCIRDRAELLLITARALQQKGWPAGFVFMFDEAWRVVEVLRQAYSAALGPECTAEPRVSALGFKPNNAPHQRYASTDSSIPRRQHSFNECHSEQGGGPTRLLSRVPLLDATVDNGAVYVVPKEFDDWFERSDAWEHSHCCQVRADGVLELGFGIQSVRPLETRQGDVLVLDGSLVHWNAQCSKDIQEPQVQIGCSFVSGEVAPVEGLPSMKRERLTSLTLKERLHIVLYSMLSDSALLPSSKQEISELFPECLWEAFDLTNGK